MADCPFARVGKRHNGFFCWFWEPRQRQVLKSFGFRRDTPRTLAHRPEPALRHCQTGYPERGGVCRSRLRPGDIVLANLTQAFYLVWRTHAGLRTKHFFGRAHDLLGRLRCLIVISSLASRSVRNLRDMQSVFDHARRIWYIGGGPVIEGPSRS